MNPNNGWPGRDEPLQPVYYGLQPRRYRPPRYASEHNYQRPPPVYYEGPDGQLLVPAAGSSRHRAASATGVRPAQVVIENNNGWVDDGYRPRPQSASHFPEWEAYYPRSRSQSRHRSRTPSPFPEDLETRRKLDKLADLEKQRDEEENLKRIKKELLLKQAEKEKEDRERAEEEKILREKAIEDYKRELAKKKEKEKKEKQEADKEFDARMRETLRSKGYSDRQIERLMAQEKKSGEQSGGPSQVAIARLNSPTYIRVKRKHLDPETLDTYALPWELDEADSSCIIIKQWIPEHDQEILFEHTRKLREAKQLTYTTTQLRKDGGQLVLIKKKEPLKKKYRS